MAGLGESTRIVQLKVRLLGLSPMIWRRVLVPESVTLRELHGILQVSMGWDSIHLYYFDIHAVRYGSLELHVESPDTPLSRFRFRAKDRFAYLYDMGDYWEHEVRIEKFLERSSKENLPRLYRRLQGLPARGLRWPSRVSGMAGESDGLRCMVGPGPGCRLYLQCPGGPRCREPDGRRSRGYGRRP